MLKKMYLTVILGCVFYLMTGCGIKPPDEQKIQTELTSFTGSNQNFDEIKSLKINRMQDNFKINKTALYYSDVEWVDKEKKAIYTAQAEIEYVHYDKGGWVLNSVIVSDDQVKMRPDFTLTEKDVKDKLLSDTPPTFIVHKRFIMTGDNLEYGDLSEYIYNDSYTMLSFKPKQQGVLESNPIDAKVSDVNITDLKIEENNENMVFKAEISVENDYLNFTGKYEGKVIYTLPNWNIKLTPVSQQVKYRYQENMYYEEFATGIYLKDVSEQVESFDIALNNDENGKAVDGIVTLIVKNYIMGPPYQLKYKVSSTVDEDTNGIILKANEWLEKDNENPSEMFDIKLYYMYTDTGVSAKFVLMCDFMRDGKTIASKVLSSDI